ncbi:GNAT family N-acetyltransferase [Janibacter sp. GXQ6167]|uniref:GNAT family N-acetyltransferase n=1 Tax=Janibacter sp. GXQ6167 TaxID=3240791 RepID=UPI0035237725
MTLPPTVVNLPAAHPVPTGVSRAGVRLHRPDVGQAAALAELFGSGADGDPEDRARRALGSWAAQWDQDGYGPWIIEDTTPGGGLVGGIDLRRAEDQIVLSVRLLPSADGSVVATRALRLALAHAVEYLPDLPLRLRARPQDVVTRFAAEACGMSPVPEFDHEDEGGTWVVLASPRISAWTTFEPQLAEAVVSLWQRVNDAGGAVGFLPGAPREEVAAALSKHQGAMARGTTTAVTITGTQGELIGVGFVVGSASPLVRHVVNVEALMTEPSRHGMNHGSLLIAGIHRVARGNGAEIATLDYRSGTGLGEFYAGAGYDEIGRVPRALRIAPGDDRDRVLCMRRL